LMKIEINAIIKKIVKEIIKVMKVLLWN
jgi:hypothetical protein